MAKLIPGSPISLEEMPTGGLLAGIVCLSTILICSPRDVVVAHVAKKNMEDEVLNI